ncbi:dihydrofolate reductase family protein [Virgibacillus sp. C22-A2]|uniref:Dihydrofolate reductase family protein n=1 Tax=Virgibacillus tibetensis TaxID=3042313 RepID=A0ABU6KJ02_9BACI|nr:dihydrofolate reductase family protein [Virgibacillus sp. C22-A2]
MRKVIATTFVTLDGVMESPDKWSFQFWSDEEERYKRDELFASDALLLGRVTYQGFAAAWPSMTDEDGFADRMNSLPKYVVSSTLNEVEWNNSMLIKDNVAEEISDLKQQSGQNIAIHGSSELVSSLMQHDLIDEYRLMVFPIVVGSGKRLFHGELATKVLKLVETKTFSTGVTVSHYHPRE